MIKKYIIIILLTLVSFAFHFSTSNFSLAVGQIVAIFVGSALVGWTFHLFASKIYKSAVLKWWAWFYGLMIFGKYFIYVMDT